MVAVTGVVTGVVAVAALAEPAAGAATRSASTDVWQSESADPQHTNDNPGEHTITPANAARLTRVWKRTQPEGSFAAPSIVNGVAYQVVNSGSSAAPTFLALDVRTGRVLWKLVLGSGQTYLRGQTVVGNLAVLPFEGWQHPGGVTVIDLARHAVVWSRYQPAPVNTSNGTDDWTAGPVLVDDQRVYMYLGSNVVNVFRLSDGAIVWKQAATSTAVRDAALGDGVLYTSGDGGVRAYAADSGRFLWSAPGWGQIVVAGGRVLSSTPIGVVADAAGGCGKSRCPALWEHDFGSVAGDNIYLGGATSSSIYISYYVQQSSPQRNSGRLKRLSLASGATQWSTGAVTFPGVPVRAGDTVWTVDDGQTLYGFSATSTSTRPLVRAVEPAGQSVVQGIAVSAGTLTVEIWPGTLLGYRVPGT